MEKSTRSTGLALFALVILFLFPITSCTTDTESDALYERATDVDLIDIDAEESEKKEVDKDLIDKRKIRKKNNTTG